MVRQFRPSPTDRFTVGAQLGLALLGISMMTIVGCSKSGSEAETADAAYMASGGQPANDLAAESGPDSQSRSDSGAALPGAMPTATEVPAALRRLAAESDLPAPVDPSNQETGGMDRAPQAAVGASPGRASEASTPNRPLQRPAASPTQLPADLPPAKLLEFLAVVDRDMQDIWSRLNQIEGGREELIRIAKMKLEASRRLTKHPEADAKAKSAGARGELQALSHLASFSDLKSAEELEALATANLESDDADLVADSRLVLIGFALEGLQNGKEGAADRVTEYIDQIAASQSASDVPTLMVMGQARDALAGYGHEEQANHIRNAIIDLFSNSPNPDLALAARELAGSVVFDDVDTLFGKIVRGQSVDVAQWRATVDELTKKAPDLQTVQFLAQIALQLEARQQRALVDSTFEALSSGFADDDSDASREVEVAITARQAREDIIGIGFNPRLPSVAGKELSMDSYRGKVVLLPFWAAAFPQSLQLIGRLKEIQAANPDDVAIVGVNLDADDLLLQEFTDQNELGFPSFRSKSSLEAEVANSVAAQFGIVSMPFLAILDKEGKVAAINFTDQGIQESVAQLLAN